MKCSNLGPKWPRLRLPQPPQPLCAEATGRKSTSRMPTLDPLDVSPLDFASAMALLETNPTQLQHASGNATPLFLIHDGGGTIFKYFLFGDLGRNVYGIHDPKFECDDDWEGGIVEMAQEYITFIKAIKGTGPILLGGQYGKVFTFHLGLLDRSLTSRYLLKGWSLGGLVSLQIARLLDDERQHGHTEHGTQPLFVAGVILIDSPYTPPWREHRDRFVEFKPEFPTWTPEWVRKNVTRRFEVCDELIDTWEPPRWASLDHSVEGSTLQVNASESTGQRSAMTEEGPRVRPVSSGPPVVLLKAMARVPLTKSKSDGLVDVDLCRDDTQLGWERYAGDLLETVHHVSGHHFNLFDQEDRARLDLFIVAQRKLANVPEPG